jgi:hypothetical protein
MSGNPFHGIVSEEDCLKILLKEFFSAKRVHIKKMFQYIQEMEYSGCEGWIHAEFLRFLSEHEYVGSKYLWKEEVYLLDQRKSLNNTTQARIDVTFKIKNRQFYIAVELKHCKEFCLGKMEKDLDKLSTIRSSEKKDFYGEKEYFRKVFSLLVHPYSPRCEDKKTVQHHLDLKNEDNICVFTKPIPSTELYYTAVSRDING